MAKSKNCTRREYSSKDLFCVSTNFKEVPKKNGQDGVFLTEECYLEFYKGFDRSENSKKPVKLTSSELRAFAYGLKELLKNEKSEYQKRSDPSMAGYDGEAKTVSLNVSDGNYFINLSVGENRENNLKFFCTKYELAAMADDIVLMCDETQKYFYKFQRDIFN